MSEVRMPISCYMTIVESALIAKVQDGRESCGLLLEQKIPGGHLWRMTVAVTANVADSSVDEFVVDPDVQRQYMMEESVRIVGTFHSHPRQGPVPSELDRGMYLGMARVFEEGLVHLIVSLKSGQPVVRAWKVVAGSMMQVAFVVC